MSTKNGEPADKESLNDNNVDNQIIENNLNFDPNEDTEHLIQNVNNEAEAEVTVIKKPVKICPINKISIEPTIFLNVIGQGAILFTSQTLLLNAVTNSMVPFFNCTSLNCVNDTLDREESEAIQKVAAEFFMYKGMIETGLQVFYSIFLGNWLKEYGCKTTTIIPILGFLFSAIILLFLNLYYGSDLRPELILVASIPLGIGGGNLVLCISVYTYISTISSDKGRTIRISVLEGSIVFGYTMGIQIGSLLLKFENFSYVFLLCVILQTTALFTCFFVKNNKERNFPTSFHSISQLLNLDSVKTILKLFTQNHTNSGLSSFLVILLFSIAGIRALTIAGSLNMLLLYTKLNFNWTNFDVSNFVTADSLLALSGISILSIIGVKIFKLTDEKIGLLAGPSFFIGPLIWALASHEWIMYLGSALASLGAISTVLSRSILSKHLDPTSVGSAFIFIGILETFSTLAAAPLYGLVYSFTVDIQPNIVFFMSASLNSLVLISFIYIFINVRPPKICSVATVSAT